MLLSDNVKEGRGSFLRAIRLRPFEIRNYFYWGIFVLGTSAFKKFRDSIKKFFCIITVYRRKGHRC